MKALLFSYLILSPFVLIAYLVEDFPIAATSTLGFGFALVVVYLDSLGKATIGYGHLLTEDDDFEEGIQYDKSLLEVLFDKDFNRSAYNAEQLLEGIDICDTAREIIVEMVFQLGIGGVSKFKKMFEALRKKDYNEAAEQMLDSQWRVQTPKRCEELSSLMRSCA